MAWVLAIQNQGFIFFDCGEYVWEGENSVKHIGVMVMNIFVIQKSHLKEFILDEEAILTKLSTDRLKMVILG